MQDLSKMNILKATTNDIDSIMTIYENARKYMCDNGNPNQWDNGYPSIEVVLNDINNGNSYIIKSDSQIVGVFVFIIGEEPTYKVIKNGNWNYNLPYGTIHRIASSGTAKNITKTCFNYCLNKIDYLRIDTHKDNIPMQNAIRRFGFNDCGIIYVRNGERIAFDYKK